MKKGLISPLQLAYSYVLCGESNFKIEGPVLGPLIAQVVEIADEFEVGSPYSWVDVPDDCFAYQWYYDTDTLSAFTLVPAEYYATAPIPELGAVLANSISVSPPTDPQPLNTTALVPPVPAEGQTLYWYNNVWVVSSFDPSLSFENAKLSLISTTEVNAASSAATQGSRYSDVQKITSPDVNSLETLSYPGTSLGQYQTYLDGIVSDATATINSAESEESLYNFNPQNLPYTPQASGVIFTGRGEGLGPLDLNVSYYTTWTSSTVVESNTELFIPGTSTIIAYGSGGAGKFDSAGNCFALGDYRVQIRETSTGFILSEFECPLNPTGEDVSF